MRFELKARLVFSGDLGKVEREVRAILSAAGPLLAKGAPKGKEMEAARIIGWRMTANELTVELESGRYVRAHDALLRLAKLLAAELGKKYKIGLREMSAEDYRILLPIAEAPAEALAEIRKLPYKVVVGESLVEIQLKEVGEAELRNRVVDRLLLMVEEIISRASAKMAEPRVVRRGPKLPHPFNENPFEIAKKLGWIREFPGRGQWIYEETYTKLIRAIEDIIIEEIARPLKFEEVMFPKLIPLEVMQRMPGYLDGVPEGMYYVSPPPRDPEAFKEFKQKLRLTKRVPVDGLKRILKEPAYVLAPAQCEPFYETFAFSHVRIEDLPVKQFDRSGWTYRWEGGGVEGLLRTQEFHRIEFVFLGSPEDVVSIRDAVVERCIGVLDKLGMEWRLLVATPFYMREGVVGDGSDSSRVATYDVEVLLPYDSSWLEIGSYNVHRTKFVETFKIKEVKGRQVWTGCCGFGTSRWVVGFLAQHGFDLSRWPDPVRKRVGSLPPVPKVVG
ncbi:MAG: serine--tRNA ligase [Candidatus Hadarchaeaceae archaeon]